MMKFGVYFAYWEEEWDVEFLPYLKKAADLGFDVLEIAAGGLLRLDEAALGRLGEEAISQNIILTACIGLPERYDTASLNETIRQNGVVYLERILDAMKKADCHLLGGITYACWPADYKKPIQIEAERAQSIKSIREVADYAAQYGITLALETVNRFEQYLFNDAKGAVQYVKEVGKPNVCVMLDSFHMNIEEDFLGDAIRDTGGYLGHFHIGEANRKVPGKGHMPWEEIGQALRDIEYDGYVVMEPFVKMGGGVGKDIRVWRDLSDGADEGRMDADIKEALQFVKNKFTAMPK